MSDSRTTSLVPVLGAVAAALAASVCCVVPLVLVLLGISGAWIANLTALDAWRPWSVGATLLCLVWAAWQLYGPKSRCRADGSCMSPDVLARRRRWFWIAVGAILVLLLFPYYAVWLF